MYSKLKLLLTYILVCCSLLQISPAMDSAETNAAPDTLITLGSIEGKTYYYHQVNHEGGPDFPAFSWQTSKTYCENAGMKLATITSQGQQNFLKSSYDFGGFDGIFWTGGRDAKTITQFSWEGSSAPLQDFGQNFAFHDTTIHSCMLYIAAETNNNGDWWGWSCTDNRGTWPLCESANSNSTTVLKI